MRSLEIVVAATAGLLARQAVAQSAAFTGMTWGSVTVGQVWPIYWSVGDGTPVSLFLGNTTWNAPIFTNLPATPGAYNWTVAAPAGFVDGNYALALVQTGAMDYSPLFTVSGAANGSGPSTMSTTTTTTSGSTSMMPNVTASATLISASADPTVTVTYWDEDCGCTTTSEICPTVAAGVATNLPGAPYTWWDEGCGCTKTAVAPVASPTVAACPGSPYGCNNYTAPTAPANASPPPPSGMPAPTETSYKGQASRLGSSGVVILGLIAGALLLS